MGPIFFISRKISCHNALENWPFFRIFRIFVQGLKMWPYSEIKEWKSIKCSGKSVFKVHPNYVRYSTKLNFVRNFPLGAAMRVRTVHRCFARFIHLFSLSVELDASSVLVELYRENHDIKMNLIFRICAISTLAVICQTYEGFLPGIGTYQPHLYRRPARQVLNKPTDDPGSKCKYVQMKNSPIPGKDWKLHECTSELVTCTSWF